MKRDTVLLIAAWKLLDKINEDPCYRDVLDVTTFYDGFDWGGKALMDDIEATLYDDGINVKEFKFDE